MADRTRLFLTGVAALGVVAVTVTGNGLWSTLRHSEPVEAAVPLSQLRDFDGITLAGPDDVVVTPGDRYAVTLTGHPDAQRYVKLYVSEGVLHVGRRSHRGWWGPGGGGVTVHVTMPGLTRLWLSGPGAIKLDKFDGKELRAMITGPGGLVAENVSTNLLAVTSHGPGSAVVSGSAETLTIKASGPGNMDFTRLAAKRADIEISGPGHANARASDSARLVVNGPGDAHVTGTTQCEIHRAGPGEADCTS